MRLFIRVLFSLDNNHAGFELSLFSLQIVVKA